MYILLMYFTRNAQQRKTHLVFNEMDTKSNVDRRSHVKKYQVKDGLPLNPIGRTGLRGRGNLGRWGPNHSGNPVVTR